MSRFLKIVYVFFNGLVLFAITLSLQFPKFTKTQITTPEAIELPVSPPVTAPLNIPSPTPEPTKLPHTPTPTRQLTSGKKNLSCVSAHLNDKYWSEKDITAQIELLSQLNVAWIRMDISQVEAEKEKGYSFFTQLVQRLNGRGIGVILILDQFGQTGRPWKAPFESPSLYGEFAGRVADNFKGKKVIYQLGNEPDYNDMDIPTYTAFLKAGYDSIKSVDNKSVVISAGVGGSNSKRYLQGIYDNGGKGKFDGFGLHRYVDPNAPKDSDFRLLDELKSIMMNAEGGNFKPIYITEVGWQTGGEDAISESRHATYIRDVYEIVSKNHSKTVPVVCLYRLADKERDDDDPHFGIVVQKSSTPGGYYKKPGFCALQNIGNSTSSPNTECK